MRRTTIVLVALGLGVGAVPAALAQGRPALVKVDAVIIEPFAQTVPVLGRFVPRQAGVVAALTRGPVSKMLVDVGDRVAKGDVLVQLVTLTVRAERDLRAAELSEKEAALATAKAQLGVSQREFERLEGLRKSVAFSQARFEDKRGEVAKYTSEVVEAEAAIARASANLRLANIELTNTAIRAPYEGVVAERHTTEGAYLNAGNAVITLINDRDLEIEADVPSIRIAGVKKGRAISIMLEDGSRHKAQVRAIVPSENVRTRTRPVRFIPFLENGMVDQLAANQSVTVLIPAGEIRDVVSVHKDAVVPRSDGAIVFVVTDGRAILRRVRLGEAVGNRFEVLEGLAVEDTVVVRGNERLVPGQRVRWPGMPQSDSSSSDAGGTSG